MLPTPVSSAASSSEAARALTFLAALSLASAMGCRPSLSSFHDKVYFCDKTIAGAQCGTNESGKDMTCFPARQLGALDFCADPCDGDVAASSDEAQVCLESKAALVRCRPSANATSGGSDCPGPLRCYRTNLLADEGVCTTFDVCSPDAACTDPARTVCASTVLRSLYPKAALKLTNLYCAQLNCKSEHAACSPGEVCLPYVLPAASRPFDICVPKCDSNLNCPPNFFCLTKASSPANPPVCIPGLLNFRCVTSNDCMLGDCIPTGEGFNVCSVPCEDDQTCDPLSGPRAAMKCVSPTPGARKHCMAPEAFGGAGCKTDSDCGTGERCTFFSPFRTTSDLGSCLLPCATDGTCRARGGVPHTCLAQVGVCYPGAFGLPCANDASCFGGNTCLPSNPDGATPIKRCTKACETDADCRAASVVATSDGWCNAGDHTCAQAQGSGFLCNRVSQCASGVCAPSTVAGDPAGATRCTPRPGEGS